MAGRRRTAHRVTLEDPLVGYNPGDLSGLNRTDHQRDPSRAEAWAGVVVHMDLVRPPRRDVFQSKITNRGAQAAGISFCVLAKRFLAPKHAQSQYPQHSEVDGRIEWKFRLPCLHWGNYATTCFFWIGFDKEFTLKPSWFLSAIPEWRKTRHVPAPSGWGHIEG